MRESGYFPAGAEFDPSAPYNQSEPEDMDFEVTCSQTLSKIDTVTTNNYIPGASGVDYETDDEGHPYAMPWHDDPDTSDTNWAEEWHNNDHYTPLQLLGLFRECLMQMNSNGVVFKSPAIDFHLIKECEDWVEDDVEYITD